MMDDLLGRQILVVEDDYVIASDLADMLRMAGAVPLGPFGREQEARAAARDLSRPIHAAILDVDLHGVPSYRVADALIARGVPLVFTTGFSVHELDPAYRHHPRLEKPVSERALLAALRLRA